MTGLLQISGKVCDRANFCNRAILTALGVELPQPEPEPQRPASSGDDD